MVIADTLFHRVLRFPHALHVGVDENIGDSPEVTVVFIHGLARSHVMWRQTIGRLEKLPVRTRVIAIDLLGFGKSPKPGWQRYNSQVQVASLHATLNKLGVRRNVILVGHSLGALVAAEYTRTYASQVAYTILCSTPIFDTRAQYAIRNVTLPVYENLRKSVMKSIRDQEDYVKKINLYARKAKIIGDDFIVDDSNIKSVTSSLEMAIENQGGLRMFMEMTQPATLVYGLYDPYIIKKYYKTLARNPHFTVKPVMAGHEIGNNRRYSIFLAKEITNVLTLLDLHKDT